MGLPSQGLQHVMTANRPDTGTPRAMDELFATTYGELRALAERRLTSERGDHTLSATALVHEAFLKLSAQAGAYRDRRHFFAIAARAMRQILIDYARHHRALKRPQAAQQVSLSLLDATDASLIPNGDDATERADFLLALDESLTALSALEERLAEVVEYRFFAGLTERETAELLGVAPRTVTRDWVRARGWLFQRLRDDTPSDA